MEPSTLTLALDVDLDTGEIAGQLMLGIDVPTVAVQRKADVQMTMSQFNAQRWDFEEGDRLSAVMKDGKVLVKLTSAWGRE